MKKAKHIVHIGAGIQAFVIITMLLLVLLGQSIPDYISNMFYVGLFLLMLGSLLSLRNQEVPAPKDKRKVIALLVILNILAVIMTVFSMS